MNTKLVEYKLCSITPFSSKKFKKNAAIFWGVWNQHENELQKETQLLWAKELVLLDLHLNKT